MADADKEISNMSTKQSAGTTTAPEVAAPPNLAHARKEQAAAKQAARGAHPAGTKVPAKTAPAKKAAAAERKAPTQSDKPKLRWDAEVAKAGDVEFGKLVEQKDGAYDAVVKSNGKTEILATGVSRNRAYAVIVAFYHRGERPVAKTVSATPKKAS
jgi:hypothetical protein